MYPRNEYTDQQFHHHLLKDYADEEKTPRLSQPLRVQRISPVQFYSRESTRTVYYHYLPKLEYFHCMTISDRRFPKILLLRRIRSIEQNFLRKKKMLFLPIYVQQNARLEPAASEDLLQESTYLLNLMQLSTHSKQYCLSSIDVLLLSEMV